MNAERKAKVYEYVKGYSKFKKIVKSAPKEAIKFRPAENAWTIHEIVIHVADAEFYASTRLRKLSAEPEVTVEVYDQVSWANKLAYHDQSMKISMKLLKYMRMANEELLISLPDSAWENKIMHPETGEKTIDTWLDSYVDHVDGHCSQIEGNIAAYNKQKESNS